MRGLINSDIKNLHHLHPLMEGKADFPTCSPPSVSHVYNPTRSASVYCARLISVAMPSQMTATTAAPAKKAAAPMNVNRQSEVVKGHLRSL